jgi:hypothetical protein
MSVNEGHIRARTIVLPAEHGAWGFLFEPIVLGLAVAPTLTGACLGLATIGAFLVRRPLKVLTKTKAPFSKSRKRQIAAKAVAGYGLVAALSFVAALLPGGWQPLLPLVAMSPFVLIFLFYDTRNQSRQLVPELMGPPGLAAVAVSMALAAGWSWPAAATLWVLLMARTIPSVTYIRARLRLEKGKPFALVPVVLVHVAFTAAAAWLWREGHAPLLAVLFLALLFVRALVGLSPLRRFHRAKQVGVFEVVAGALYVMAVAIGYHIGP